MGAALEEALRGEVQLNRVKHHLYEAGYEYDMSLTADAVQAQLLHVYTWTCHIAPGPRSSKASVNT